jgi:hypothetical protein
MIRVDPRVVSALTTWALRHGLELSIERLQFDSFAHVKGSPACLKRVEAFERGFLMALEHLEQVGKADGQETTS